ncbi:MAG: ATP-binding protein [Succinivibrio sp.]|nr:ATP-binding protein [Succinivibrio sp.]
MRLINTDPVHVDETFFLENVVYNELLCRDYEVYVGKTYKGEVDFVVMDGGKKCFIQVAYLLNGTQTIKREFDAFRPINDAAPKYVLSLDRLNFSRDGIVHLNILDFLQGRESIVLT